MTEKVLPNNVTADSEIVYLLQDQYITVKEASLIRGCRTASIYDLIKRERLSSISMFGITLVLKKDILDFKVEKPGPKQQK